MWELKILKNTFNRKLQNCKIWQREASILSVWMLSPSSVQTKWPLLLLVFYSLTPIWATMDLVHHRTMYKAGQTRKDGSSRRTQCSLQCVLKPPAASSKVEIHFSSAESGDQWPLLPVFLLHRATSSIRDRGERKKHEPKWEQASTQQKGSRCSQCKDTLGRQNKDLQKSPHSDKKLSQPTFSEPQKLMKGLQHS